MFGSGADYFPPLRHSVREYTHVLPSVQKFVFSPAGWWEGTSLDSR